MKIPNHRNTGTILLLFCIFWFLASTEEAVAAVTRQRNHICIVILILLIPNFIFQPEWSQSVCLSSPRLHRFLPMTAQEVPIRGRRRGLGNSKIFFNLLLCTYHPHVEIFNIGINLISYFAKSFLFIVLYISLYNSSKRRMESNCLFLLFVSSHLFANHYTFFQA